MGEQGAPKVDIEGSHQLRQLTSVTTHRHIRPPC